MGQGWRWSHPDSAGPQDWERQKVLQNRAHCCWSHRAQADLMSRRVGTQGHSRVAAPSKRVWVQVQWRWEVACGTEAAVPEPGLTRTPEPTLDSCKEAEMPLQHLPHCGPWISTSLSATSDNEVWHIYNLFRLLCILPDIHCPVVWITDWQLNNAFHFCWLGVTSSGTPNQQRYISLPWLEF